MAVTIHLYALRVQAIDWLGRLLHQRKAANWNRTLAVSLLQTADVVINRTARFCLSSQLQPGNALCRAKPEGARDSKMSHRLEDFTLACTLAATWSLGYTSLPPRFFSEYLGFKTNVAVSGASEREKPGGPNGAEILGITLPKPLKF